MENGGMVLAVVVFRDVFQRQRGDQQIGKIHGHLAGEGYVWLAAFIHELRPGEIVCAAHLIGNGIQRYFAAHFRDHVREDVLCDIGIYLFGIQLVVRGIGQDADQRTFQCAY